MVFFFKGELKHRQRKRPPLKTKMFLLTLKLFLFIFLSSSVNKVLGGFPVNDVDEDKLIFLQSVWRHGDRSPIDTYKNDPYQEDSWLQGWGQLTPKGMEQHSYLGRHRLKPRYIEKLKFLSPYYKSQEIYVRSTDVNRTIASAMSNMFGMYGESARAGIDYPNCTNHCWPTGFIPIAIHSLLEDTDYTLNADAHCPRQDELQKLLKETPEYKRMVNDQKKFFDYFSKNGGEIIDPLNLWKVYDALYIEQIYKRTLPDFVNKTWDDGRSIFDVVNDTAAIVERWINGLGLKPYKGIDFRSEASKIRGGTLLWSIIGHMKDKIHCIENPKDKNCKFFNNLKYYAYSAHDTTLAGLFSTLGFSKTNFNEDGYPRYSSCITIELWKKASNGKFYIKFLYWPLDEKMEDVTDEIKGCSIPCSMNQLIKRSIPYKAEPNIEKWCETPLFPSNNEISSSAAENDESKIPPSPAAAAASTNLMSQFGAGLKYVLFDSWYPFIQNENDDF